MITEKDFLTMESGSWDSDEDLVERVVDLLKEENIYKKAQVYRVQYSLSEKPIRKKIIKEGGNLNKDSSIRKDQAYGCNEDELAHYCGVCDARSTPYSYIIGYNPKKIDYDGSTVFTFKDPSNKPESIDFVVEIKND